jgi:hypothetical protein
MSSGCCIRRRTSWRPGDGSVIKASLVSARRKRAGYLRTFTTSRPPPPHRKGACMPFVRGFLRVVGRGHPGHDLPEGERPVDPGYGVEAPVDPGFGGGRPQPPDPDFDLPVPPPGVWPPPSGTLPIVPAPPGTPPGAIWPPVSPPVIWPRPPHVGGGPAPTPPPAPGQPPTAGTPLPPTPTTYWLVAGIPGVGWRYVAIDPSIRPLPPEIGSGPAPPAGAHPDHELPPTAQPRRA